MTVYLNDGRVIKEASVGVIGNALIINNAYFISRDNVKEIKSDNEEEE